MSLAAQGRLLAQSLSARLLFLLTIALLPLGLIAVFQTFSLVSEAEDLSRREMLAQTMEAARAEMDVISEAHGAARALGAVAVEIGPDGARCSELMQAFTAADPRFVFAGFIERDGRMRCVSSGEPTDFSAADSWRTFVADPRPSVVINRQGTTTGLSVLIASAPVFDDSGTLLGAVSLSIPHSLLDVLLRNDIDMLEVAMVDGAGKVLSASTGIDESAAFDDLGLEPARLDIPSEGEVLPGDGPDAPSFAVIPLRPADVFIVGKWASEHAPRPVTYVGTAAPLFPVAMWIAGLFVAFFAMERLVLRHLKVLRGHMRRFSIDNLEASYVRLIDAPSEISDIGDSYNALLDRITDDTVALAEALHDKEVLLKEVHHRVKNNLQLIASILNMQLRQIRSPGARSVLRGVQDRVMSLATIHKLLYSDTQVDAVRADLLLGEIINSTVQMGSGGKAGLTTDLSLAPVELDPDRAVPLALLVTEALTNALKYVGAPPDGTPEISVRLAEEDSDGLRLEVRNTLVPEDIATAPPAEGTGLGTRLIQAFVVQLDGSREVTTTDEDYTLRVRFARHAPETTADEAA